MAFEMSTHQLSVDSAERVKLWTEREHLAAMAMQGLLSSTDWWDTRSIDETVEVAFNMADSMLAHQDGEGD